MLRRRTRTATRALAFNSLSAANAEIKAMPSPLCTAFLTDSGLERTCAARLRNRVAVAPVARNEYGSGSSGRMDPTGSAR